jgi:hypothetical protein
MTGMGWRLALAVWAAPLAAQTPPPIQDNSFLIEEAYNQERGVVQHISLFSRERGGGSWNYSFTQEWPFRGQRHQLSYGIQLQHQTGPTGGSTGLGDVAFNYRLQVVGGEGKRVWFAPRLSAILPSGDWRKGRGFGSVGAELMFPVSIEVSPKLAAHFNAGFSAHPSARDPAGDRATPVDLKAGVSAIYMLAPTVNQLVESVLQGDSEDLGPGVTRRGSTFLVSPGVRWAHNFRSGLQIVPGLAYTVGLGDASDQSALLVYLSFEHSFKKN